MSKSDQFAVPVEAAATVPPQKSAPRRVWGWGCGGVVAFLILLAVTVNIAARNQPVTAQQTIRSLAGVPIYPGAAFDEELTREALGGLANTGWINPAKIKTVAGLRTSASLKEVLPYYDSKMAFYGFTATTLGGGSGVIQGKDYIGGASYTTPGTQVIVQMYSDPGEDNKLLVYRFDAQTKKTLSQPSNIVTPEDIKKAKAAAEKKRRQNNPTEKPK